MKMKRLEEIEAELKRPSTHQKDLKFIVELCRGVRELHAQLRVAREDAAEMRGTDQVQRATAADQKAHEQSQIAGELGEKLQQAESRLQDLSPEADNLGAALRRATQAEAVVSRAYRAPPYLSIIQHNQGCPNATTPDLTCGCGNSLDILAVLRRTGDIA